MMLLLTKTILLLLLLACCALAGGRTKVPRTPFNNIQKRIIGGTAVSTNEYPFAVHLTTTFGTEQFLCGGTLIDNSYVVTAAHCLMNEDTNETAEAGQVSVCYGSNKLSSQRCTTARTLTLHPDFSLQSLVNDIAIIEISALSFSSSVSSVPIYTGKLPENTELVTMGWGMTNSSDTNSLSNVLLSTDIKIGSPELCAQAESSYSSADGAEVCTSNNLTPGKDSCQGDSGSPTIITSGGTNYLVALTSSGVNMDDPGSSECAATDGLAFYTHIYYFMDFITSTTSLSSSDLTSGTSGSNSGN
ncbi:Transmembrane protease serine 11F, partial [Coemansia sp. RSA 1933]